MENDYLYEIIIFKQNIIFLIHQQHFDYFLSFLLFDGCYNFMLLPIPPLIVFFFLFKIRSIS